MTKVSMGSVVLILAIIWTGFIFSGVKEFQLWNQVRNFYGYPVIGDMGDDFALISIHERRLRELGLYHMVQISIYPRMLTVIPAVAVQKMTGLDLVKTFSLYVVLLLGLIASLMGRLLDSKWAIVNAGMIFATSLLMNGRLVFAFLAVVLWMNIQQEKGSGRWWGDLFWALLATFFVSVSSGAHLILFGMVFLDLLRRCFRGRGHMTFHIVFLVTSAPIVLAGCIRNYLWHGGSLESLMTHGLGFVFGLSLLSIFGMGALLAFEYLRRKRLLSVDGFLTFLYYALPVLGTFAGISTGAAFVPLYFVSVFWMIDSLKERRSFKLA